MSSPLGVWLLLAACAGAAEGAERSDLEEVLGCPAEEAGALLNTFVQNPPPAMSSALALWVRPEDVTTKFQAWSATLPVGIDTGGIPTQADADAWVQQHTLGLIRRFPIRIDGLTRLLLASSLATKVTWDRPFDVTDTADRLDGGPWESLVQRLLYDPRPTRGTRLATTRAADVVAVHMALARDDLTVISVSADLTVERQKVVEAAHEVAAGVATDCSLFELPLGRGHSWDITEREIDTWEPGQRVEWISAAVLPAWRAAGELDLKQSEAFGVMPAIAALLRLIGNYPAGDVTEARQTAVASYTRFGFEAAAVTAVGIAGSGAPGQNDEKGIERTADLIFGHPFAAIAVAGRSEWSGLPLFTAWVGSPQETDPEEVG